MRKLLLLSAIMIYISAPCQVMQFPISSSYAHLSTYSRSHHDLFSFAGNQAALSAQRNLAVGFLGERRFMLQELSHYRLLAALPTNSGNFGINVNYAGSQAYNESRMGLAYGRKLSEKWDVGVQFNYNHIRIGEYGSDHAISVEGGLILHLTEQLHTGVHVFNPTRARLGKSGEESVGSMYSLGLGYDVSQKSFLSFSLEKIEDQPVNVNAGLHYGFDDRIFARAGISTASASYFFGVGFMLPDIRLDITTSIHPHLGLTPALVLIYSRK